MNTKKNFRLLNQNVQSIGTSFLKLQHILSSQAINILCITEHWKSEEELMLYTPPGYVLVSSYCREKGKHGGCAIFLEKGMQYSHRKDFKNLSVIGCFECCVSQIMIDSEKYLIICIYRPNSYPLSNVDIFFERFISVLDGCQVENVKVIISGDFNIDLLSVSNDSRLFFSILETYNLKVSLLQPTRITPNSATCLDNVISNIDGITTLVEGHLSDHSGQIFTFFHQINEVKPIETKTNRIYNEHNHQVFESLLSDINWSKLYDIPVNNINEMWNFFGNRFDETFQR